MRRDSSGLLDHLALDPDLMLLQMRAVLYKGPIRPRGWMAGTVCFTPTWDLPWNAGLVA